MAASPSADEADVATKLARFKRMLQSTLEAHTATTNEQNITISVLSKHGVVLRSQMEADGEAATQSQARCAALEREVQSLRRQSVWRVTQLTLWLEVKFV